MQFRPLSFLRRAKASFVEKLHVLPIKSACLFRSNLLTHFRDHVLWENYAAFVLLIVYSNNALWLMNNKKELLFVFHVSLKHYSLLQNQANGNIQE